MRRIVMSWNGLSETATPPRRSPFVWTKSAGEILEEVARAKQLSESKY
jgi:hypothetical protein